MTSTARQLLKDAVITLSTDCPSIFESGERTSALHLLSICGGLNNDTFETCMTDVFLEKIVEKVGEDITFFRNTCIQFREDIQKLNVDTIVCGKSVRFVERIN
jgi:hypothetical protein